MQFSSAGGAHGKFAVHPRGPSSPGRKFNPEASHDFPFPMDYAMSHNLTFRIGKCPVPETWSDLVPLVQVGKLKPERVITHELGLSEGEYAYQLFDARTDGVMKIMLEPGR